MIYQQSPTPTWNYPLHDIDPDLKLQPEWHLEVVKAIYGYHWGSWLKEQQDKIPMLMDYANGCQDPAQYGGMSYKARFLNEQEGNQEKERGGDFVSITDMMKGFSNINFDQIFTVAPRMRAALQGIMEQQDNNIRLFARDQYSGQQRQRKKAEMQVNMRLKKAGIQIPGQQDQPLPQTNEELAMYEQLGGLTLPYEVGIQKSVDWTYDNEGCKRDIQARVVDSLWCTGIAAVIDLVDTYTQRVKPEYIDWDDLIVEYSKDSREFKDITFYGWIKYYTVADLRIKTGWSEEKLHSLALMFTGNSTLGNPNLSLNEVTTGKVRDINYNDVRIPVLFYRQKTVDSKYFTKFKDTGNTLEEKYRQDGWKSPRKVDNKNRTTDSEDVVRWYEGNWVIGSTDLFDIGPMFDQPFDHASKEPRCGLHLYVLPYTCPNEQCIPLYDQAAMAFLTLQNDISNSMPSTIVTLDIDSLNEMKIAGKKLHPFDTIKIGKQAGIFLYKKDKVVIPGETSKYNNIIPFGLEHGGTEAAFKNFDNALSVIYKWSSTLTGMDMLTMNASSPTSEQTATFMKLSTSATRDSLKHIYTGWLSIWERSSMNLAIIISQLIVNNDDETRGYYGIISDYMINSIKDMGKISPIELGIQVIAMPTQDELNKIMEAANQAVMGGKNGIPAITFSENLFIFDRLKYGAPVKEIIAYIAYKESQRNKMEQEKSQMSMQMNAQIQDAAVQRKTQGDVAKIEAKGKQDRLTEMVKIAGEIAKVKQKLDQESMNTLKELMVQTGIDIGMANASQGQQGTQQPQQSTQMQPNPQEQPQQPEMEQQ